jgi:hypothetical protein
VWDPATALFTLRQAAPMAAEPTALVTRKFGRAR